MQHVLTMTMHTANNPFGDVPPAHLLRTFQTLSKETTSHIRDLQTLSFEGVTLTDFEHLENLSTDLHALAQILREVGNRRNPFRTLEKDSDDNRRINWITFYDYQKMFDFYLTVALPQYPAKAFYGWLCHDMIDETYRLLGTGSFLVIMAHEQKLSRKIYDEMINRANTALWKFEAIVDAAAKFECQQFGEVTDESR